MTKPTNPAEKPRGDDTRTQDQHAADDRQELKRQTDRVKAAKDAGAFDRSAEQRRLAAHIVGGPGSDERRARAQADAAQLKRIQGRTDGKDTSGVRKERGRASRLTEPLGMDDVPEGASQLFRDRYASVLRDFHSGRPLGPTNRVATSLTEAKAIAAKFAGQK